MPLMASRFAAQKSATSTAVDSLQPLGQEIPAAMSSRASVFGGTVLRQNLWQELYAVVLQVRICAEGGRRVTAVPTATTGHDAGMTGHVRPEYPVRDADMLDAIGAVGIARAFMFGGFLGEPMWIRGGNNLEGVKIFSHAKTTSVVHHFHEKLLEIEFEMLTPQGRMLAAERLDYMKEFIKKLMSEIA